MTDLTPVERALLGMRRERGLSRDEIAELAGLSPGAVEDVLDGLRERGLTGDDDYDDRAEDQPVGPLGLVVGYGAYIVFVVALIGGLILLGLQGS